MAFSWTDLVGPVIGAGLGLFGSKLESDSALDAEEAKAAALERNADKALAAAEPWATVGE